MSIDKELRVLVHQLGATCSLLASGLEDEGDRVYLSTSNYADTVKTAALLYDEYCFSTNDHGEDVELPV